MRMSQHTIERLVDEARRLHCTLPCLCFVRRAATRVRCAMQAPCLIYPLMEGGSLEDRLLLGTVYPLGDATAEHQAQLVRVRITLTLTLTLTLA